MVTGANHLLESELKLVFIVIFYGDEGYNGFHPHRHQNFWLYLGYA